MIQKHGHAFQETDKCCYNCKHILWLIGVGQGLRCGHNIQEGVKPPTIPGISHVCENFKGKQVETEWSCKCSKCSGKYDHLKDHADYKNYDKITKLTSSTRKKK